MAKGMNGESKQRRLPLSVGKSLLYVAVFWALTGLLFYGLFKISESVSLYDLIQMIVKAQ